MFQMLAEFERAMIRERVMAGLARAAKVQTIRAARFAGKSVRTIARDQGVA